MSSSSKVPWHFFLEAIRSYQVVAQRPESFNGAEILLVSRKNVTTRLQRYCGWLLCVAASYSMLIWRFSVLQHRLIIWYSFHIFLVRIPTTPAVYPCGYQGECRCKKKNVLGVLSPPSLHWRLSHRPDLPANVKYFWALPILLQDPNEKLFKLFFYR